jgi:hypothetical protein
MAALLESASDSRDPRAFPLLNDKKTAYVHMERDGLDRLYEAPGGAGKQRTFKAGRGDIGGAIPAIVFPDSADLDPLTPKENPRACQAMCHGPGHPARVSP